MKDFIGRYGLLILFVGAFNTIAVLSMKYEWFASMAVTIILIIAIYNLIKDIISE